MSTEPAHVTKALLRASQQNVVLVDDTESETHIIYKLTKEMFHTKNIR